MAEKLSQQRRNKTSRERVSVSPESWQLIKEHFEHAREHHGLDRLKYLKDLGERNPELLREVQHLLAQTVDQFLEQPPWAAIGKRSQQGSVFAPGQVVLNRFEIRSFLGAGGSGQVYRAYDRHRQSEVALKTLQPTRLHGCSAAEELRNEVNVASLVTHPNVCRIYDIVIPPDDAVPVFITMEYLAGQTLAVCLQNGRFPPADAHSLVSQVASGLMAAHACEIVHRDLKPGNIMVTAGDGPMRAVIMDFGLARETRAGSHLQTGMSGEFIVGTPAYMAPEQLTGAPVTHSTDIYSLGIVMFELVTGRLPFEGESAVAVALARLYEDAPRARSINRQVDRCWDHVIYCCLQREAAKRPSSAAHVLQLLAARPPTIWTRRLIPVAILAAGGVTTFRWLEPPIPKPEAKALLEEAQVAMSNQSKDGFQEAIQKLQKATTVDPVWAMPWAELAYAYAAASNARFIDAKAALTGAQRSALEAIRLEPRQAKAHAALDWTQSLDFDRWPLAEDSFKRALALDSADGQVRYWYAVHLRKKGRFGEAESQIKSAMQLTHRADPNVWSELTFLYWTARRQKDFLTNLDEQLVAFPNFPQTRFLNARRLKLLGNFDAALDELSFSERLGQNAKTVLAERASVEAYRGNRQGALAKLRLLQAMSFENEVDSLLIAGVYAKIGDLDRAFASLEGGLRRKDSTLLSLATSPVLDPLRRDPRYAVLAKRLHFMI